MKRILLIPALLLGLAHAAPQPVRDSAYDWRCVNPDGTATNHQRQDTAIYACQTRAEANPGQTYYIEGGRYRVLVAAPVPDPIPDPIPDPVPDPVPDPAPTPYVATHYATVTGAGSHNGSLGNEWSLQEAMQRAVAGNVVEVAPGTYTGLSGSNWNPAWYPANNGTDGNPIIFYARVPAATNPDSPNLSKLRSPSASVPTYGGRGYAPTNTHDVVYDGFWADQADGSYPVASQGQVNIGGGTQRITIRRGLFDRGSIPGTDNFASIFLQQTEGIVIQDNLFRGGSAGNGSHNNAAISYYNCESCLVENNSFEDQDIGIFVKAHRASADGNTGIIRFNRFSNHDVFGIEFNEADNAKGGIDFYQNLLVNSGVKFDWSSDVTGKAVRVHRNTVIGFNDDTNTLAVFPTSYEAQMSIRDNIFVSNAAQQYGILFWSNADPNAMAQLDYNLYHRPGGLVRFYQNGVTYSGLPAWVAAKSTDDHSIEAAPVFVGGGDYRLVQNGQPALTASSTGGPVGAYLSGTEEIGVRANPGY